MRQAVVKFIVYNSVQFQLICYYFAYITKQSLLANPNVVCYFVLVISTLIFCSFR